MRDFRLSFIVTFICLAAAFWWGLNHPMGALTALWLALVLGVLEVSLSFDNAVVNAGVLKEMDPFWQKMFLTIGILIAVFGMRLVFPIVIVAVATQQGFGAVIDMALERPEEYSKNLIDHYAVIAAFGGMFLMLVFLSYFIDDEKDTHWIQHVESAIIRVAKVPMAAVVVSALILLSCLLWVSDDSKHLSILYAGAGGIVLFVLVDKLGALFENEDTGNAVSGTVKRAGFASFVYLEILDASFSFDGVIGAFAITRDVVIIMLGLAIGAMFVRSMTVYLVKKGTLDQYIFLEHGAHWAIGVLAVLMLVGIEVHVPEVFTGLIGVAFIVASVWSSVRHNKRAAAAGG